MLLKPESPTSFPPVFCLKKLVISLKRASLCLEQKKPKEQCFSGTCQSVWNYSCISMNVQMWRLDLGGDKWGVGWCEWEGRRGNVEERVTAGREKRETMRLENKWGHRVERWARRFAEKRGRPRWDKREEMSGDEEVKGGTRERWGQE